jgi:hypothetical protein
MTVTALHDDIAHMATLLGTWSGTGRGSYPTIEPFEYAESITFAHVGKPFLSYSQRTRSLGGVAPGQPMHAESGYWRFPAPGHVEIVLSHPTGVTEIEEGTVELGLDGSLVMRLASTTVALTSTAKSVTGIERTIRIAGDELEYDVSMAAVGVPMQHHLSARLVRDQSD